MQLDMTRVYYSYDSKKTVYPPKKCNVCRIIKPVDEFYKAKTNAGFSVTCKHCKRKRERDRVTLKNLGKVKEGTENLKLKYYKSISENDNLRMANLKLTRTLVYSEERLVLAQTKIAELEAQIEALRAGNSPALPNA